MSALVCSCNGGTCLACTLTDLKIEQHEWAMLAYPIEATLAGIAASGAVTAQDGRHSLGVVVAPDASAGFPTEDRAVAEASA